MTEDKRTKADLLDELSEAEATIRLAKSDAYDAHQALPNAPARIPEADALAACIRALDALTESTKNNGYGSSYSLGYTSGDSYRSQTASERVLRSLAAKYSVPLIEIRTEPCSKFHVENPDEERVLSALRMSGPFR